MAGTKRGGSVRLQPDRRQRFQRRLGLFAGQLRRRPPDRIVLVRHQVQRRPAGIAADGFVRFVDEAGDTV